MTGSRKLFSDPSRDAEPRWKTITRWVFCGAALIALYWNIWDVNFPSQPAQRQMVAGRVNVVEQVGELKRLQQVVAASVPEAKASAPSAPSAVVTPPVAPEKATATDTTEEAANQDALERYTVRRGDTLSHLWPRDWKEVCELNNLANCDQIRAGQVLNAATMPNAPAETVKASKPTTAKAVTPSVPKTNDAGEILYRRVNTAPVRDCGKRDIADVSRDAWQVLGLSTDDQAYLALNADLKHGPRINITEAEGRVDMPSGMRLEQVTFCRAGKVVARGPYRTDWFDGHPAVKGERFVLPSGKVLVWMRNCFNWVILPEEKTVFVPTPPTPEEPPVVVTEPPPPEPSPVPVVLAPEPPPPVAEEAPRGFCGLDPHAVLGAEHEPRHDGGDQADSTFFAAGLYCTRRNATDDGTHGFGAKLTASEWSGTVNQRAGKYKGDMYLIGPAYEFISDNGWDMEVSLPMYGKLHERFSQDKYASERSFDLLGLSAGANFYERRLAGKEWFPETQVFGTWARPLSRLVRHSWDGQAIADTADLSRFGTYLNLGVRQWLHETPDSKVLPYAQLGYFLETPSSESMSVRLGISDPARIAGIGVGFDQDLQNGGDAVAAWGWWIDIIKGVQVTRSVYRKHQVITDAAARGVTVEENRKGNIESIRFGDTWKEEAKQ